MDATIDDLNNGQRGVNWVGMIVVAFFLLFAVALAMTLSAHALEKHGNDATWVKLCQENYGTHETWTRAEDGRQANIVCLPEGKFGIEICEASGVQVTCFVKEKLKKIEQVYRYLRNGGYAP